ncbi:hypothetical protein BJ912DRAFT_927072 [Pholiota molesta]|nr:hypothetical protein BJ912DRAFT_927072 [Pholiota molesta]
MRLGASEKGCHCGQAPVPCTIRPPWRLGTQTAKECDVAANSELERLDMQKQAAVKRDDDKARRVLLACSSPVRGPWCGAHMVPHRSPAITHPPPPARREAQGWSERVGWRRVVSGSNRSRPRHPCGSAAASSNGHTTTEIGSGMVHLRYKIERASVRKCGTRNVAYQMCEKHREERENAHALHARDYNLDDVEDSLTLSDWGGAHVQRYGGTRVVR